MSTPTATSKANNGAYDVSANQWNATVTAVKNQPYAYVIYIDGSNYCAKNGATGVVESTSTDAAVPIQYAMDAADVAGGGIVFLTGGTFTAQQTIYLREEVTLQGADMRGTTLTLADNIDANLLEWTPTGDEYFARVNDMEVNANRTHNANNYALYTSASGGGNPKDFSSNHVWYSGAALDGAHVDYCWGYKFTDCIFESNTQDGIYYNGPQIEITGFYAALNGRHGVNGGANGIAYISGQASYNDQIGFVTTGAENTGFIICSYNGYDGAYINGSYNNLSITSYNNGRAGDTYYNIKVYGNRNVIGGSAYGSATYNGHHVLKEVYLSGLLNFINIEYATIAYSGTATEKYAQIMFGHSVNEGDPDSAGWWNGRVKYDGMVIRDITNSVTYCYDSRVSGGRYVLA